MLYPIERNQLHLKETFLKKTKYQTLFLQACTSNISAQHPTILISFVYISEKVLNLKTARVREEKKKKKCHIPIAEVNNLTFYIIVEQLRTDHISRAKILNPPIRNA